MLLQMSLCCLLLFFAQCSANHRAFTRDEINGDGPEDLLLEQLISNWRQLHPPRQDPIDYRQESSNGNRVKETVNQHFAYRPKDPQFSKSKVNRQQEDYVEPPPMMASRIQSGQKEDIDFLESRPEIAGEIPPQPADPGASASGTKPTASESAPAEKKTHERHEHHESHEPVAYAVLGRQKNNGGGGGGGGDDSFSSVYFTALIAGGTAAAVGVLLGVGVCFYRWQVSAKSAQDVEYPAYGITGPGPSPTSRAPMKISPSSSWLKSPKSAISGDKKLAHSAHMFHFQHQKQQVIAMDNHFSADRQGFNSGGESDEDNEEGDYTVYECPGLAPAGEMEVKNPLFLDDPTPATPKTTRQSE